MKGDNLDGYIARFQHLAVEAGFDCNAAVTVSLFTQGLKKQLVSDIVNRERVTPATFDEWVTAAQTQQQKAAYKQALITPGGQWTQWQARPLPPHYHNGHH